MIPRQLVDDSEAIRKEVKRFLDEIEDNPNESGFLKRKQTVYERIYNRQCKHHYDNIAKYITTNGLYLPDNLLTAFDYFTKKSPEKKYYRQAKIIHELVTEHFYNRTWTQKGVIVLDKNNNPETREAFGIILTVYKQSDEDIKIQTLRRTAAWLCKAASTNFEDFNYLYYNERDTLNMYREYPDGTKVNPFEPAANMEPVCVIEKTPELVKFLPQKIVL